MEASSASDWLARELNVSPKQTRYPPKQIVAEYDYRNEWDELLYQVVRVEPKGFRQRRPDDRADWVWNLQGVRRVPYRLPQLLAASRDTIAYVAEGEKDVDNLVKLGLLATCNSEGAGNWKAEFADFFVGRDIVVLVDCDDVGRKHARTVAASIAAVARRVRVLELPDLPPKGDISDWLAAGGTLQQLDDLVASTPPFNPISAVPEQGLALVHFEAMKLRITDRYLVKRLLGSDGMTVLYGEAGTGKTFLALHLALMVAAGIPFLGSQVRRVGVIYVAAEAGKSIENRVAAYKHEFEFPEVMPFAAVTSPIDLCTNNVDLTKLILAVEQATLEVPVGLIIVDTLSRVMGGGNENHPDHMGALVQNIDTLRTKTGAHVLIVHHSGKDVSRGARGHSLLRAAADTEIEVIRDDVAKLLTARATKQRDYTTQGAFILQLRVVELGIDEDGDPVTSCVIESAEGADKPAPKVKISAIQTRALDLLADAITRGGEIPAPGSDRIPPGVRCTTESVWRECCYRGDISSGKQDAKRRAFTRAAEALLAAGRIGKWDQWVWPI